MIYRFTIISDEVDDFVREIQIDPEATFLDFHEAILKSVGYTNDQMTSFFICDDDWEKEKEVTLEEMDDNPEMDSWIMKETTISELVEDEKQKLWYVFDYMTERLSLIHIYPVFGFINIPKGLLYDIVRHPLLQRLTRIKQVGLSSVCLLYTSRCV